MLPLGTSKHSPSEGVEERFEHLHASDRSNVLSHELRCGSQLCPGHVRMSSCLSLIAVGPDLA